MRDKADRILPRAQRLAYSAKTKKLVVQMDHDAGFDRAALEKLGCSVWRL